ncbi:hypothetical protein THOB06_10006 [Vibrio rotiferianus]|nr:hypothetical protein THOG10_10006 [Vibrio rotiferianus]CAH1554545.1 hypothetical protein THOB06_10006 [Vibrio rotiferianus]
MVCDPAGLSQQITLIGTTGTNLDHAFVICVMSEYEFVR